MRYAVISDIHANPNALAAVLADLKSKSADRILCCGDIVGYNAMPNEAIDLLREHSVLSIAGNHDLLVSGVESDSSQFSARTAAAVQWTKTVISEVNLEFLRQLPRTTVIDGKILLFHGALSGVPFPEMRRLLDLRSVQDTFQDMAANFAPCYVGFFGHVHRARVYVDDAAATLQLDSTDSRWDLSPANRYLVNPGSVCESRDSDPRGSYVIYDSSDNSITLHKVEFNDRAVHKANRRAGLTDTRLMRIRHKILRAIRRYKFAT